jgi:mRNA-degrading endonuclease RelE of RelBE toxin-antitoxin system
MIVAFTVGIIAHVKASATRPSGRKRLHNVGIRVVFQFRPFDVSITVFVIAKSLGTKFEVEENKGCQYQHASGYRHTDD